MEVLKILNDDFNDDNIDNDDQAVIVYYQNLLFNLISKGDNIYEIKETINIIKLSSNYYWNKVLLHIIKIYK